MTNILLSLIRDPLGAATPSDPILEDRNTHVQQNEVKDSAPKMNVKKKTQETTLQIENGPGVNPRGCANLRKEKCKVAVRSEWGLSMLTLTERWTAIFRTARVILNCDARRRAECAGRVGDQRDRFIVFDTENAIAPFPSLTQAAHGRLAGRSRQNAGETLY